MYLTYVLNVLKNVTKDVNQSPYRDVVYKDIQRSKRNYSNPSKDTRSNQNLNKDKNMGDSDLNKDTRTDLNPNKGTRNDPFPNKDNSMSESNLNKDNRSDSNPVKNTRSDTNPNKNIKIIERELSKVLERERDFEESDFEIDEFDYFIKSEPYTNSIGTFDEDWIADEDIVKAKHILKESKEISSIANKKLNLLLTQKFYGDNDCFPRQASY